MTRVTTAAGSVMEFSSLTTALDEVEARMRLADGTPDPARLVIEHVPDAPERIETEDQRRRREDRDEKE